MSITKNISKIYTAWGRNTSASKFFSDYWVYISNALNGNWGTSTSDNVDVYHLGRSCYWKSKVFTTTSDSVTLSIPVQTNESYSYYVNNLTTHTVSVYECSSNTSSLTIPLTVGNKYQITSMMINEK